MLFNSPFSLFLYPIQYLLNERIFYPFFRTTNENHLTKRGEAYAAKGLRKRPVRS